MSRKGHPQSKRNQPRHDGTFHKLADHLEEWRHGRWNPTTENRPYDAQKHQELVVRQETKRRAKWGRRPPTQRAPLPSS